METARTVLFSLHEKLGARMTEFAGFALPVSYSGIVAEHLGVRAKAGLFDLSHMGEFEVRGSRALALLEQALTNSAARLREGQAQYTLICTPEGGVIDDIIVYRLAAERYMLCVNASNIAADRDWLSDLNRDGKAGGGADFRDTSNETSLIALQGPASAAILARLASPDPTSLPRFGVAETAIAGARCILARTGYTGEDGFELFVANEHAERLFTELLAAGGEQGVLPCGLGARDTLRLEAGLALYGHELDRNTTPVEAGLSHFVKLGRDFIGAAAIEAELAGGLRKRLIGLRTDDGRSIARQGYKLVLGERAIGVVTSGTFAPSFERPLAMAYVQGGSRAPQVSAGSRIEVEIRKNTVAATVVSLPFYRRGRAAAATGAQAREVRGN